MADIQTELALLNETVISPIFSWVTPFSNFVTNGDWAEVCGTARVLPLNFDDQMKEFVKIKIKGECCQRHGICGEQFASDISFNENGKVTATRFRFQHKPVRHQRDYIRSLLETRRACDKFAKDLIPLRDRSVHASLHASNDGGHEFMEVPE